MGIFDRISNILKAKTGATREQARDLERSFSSAMSGLDQRIDQARDRASRALGRSPANQNPNSPQTPQLPPNEQIAETEKTFDKMLKELEQAIEEARVYVAEFTSIENKLYQEKSAALDRAKEWKERAERAILTGRDDIAREALMRKQEFEQIAIDQQNQIEAQQSVSSQVKDQLQALVNKRAEIKRNKDLLISRQRSLQIQEKMNHAIYGSSGNLQNEIEKIEKNVMQAEALAEAHAELNGLPRPSKIDFFAPPSNQRISKLDELSQEENKAVVQQQMKEIQNRFNPPKQEPWFEPSRPQPVNKKDVWFEETNKPTEPPQKKDIWFSEENKTPSTEGSNKAENIWFQESTIPQNTQQKSKDIWFEQTPQNTQESVKKDIWFDPPPTTTIKRANSELPNQNTLSEGANVSLSKVSNLTKLEIRMGWETFKNNLEINGSIILASSNGKVRNDSDFIYYNTPTSSCGALKHLGKDPSSFDDEIISIDFEKIPEDVTKLVFSAMIYEAESRHQSFQETNNVWLRIINPLDGKELASYFYKNRGRETVLILGEIYNYKGEWKFKALGQGFAAGLIALLNSYGLTVE